MNDNLVEFHPSNPQCAECHCRTSCLFACLQPPDRARWLASGSCATFHRSDHLYRQGEEISSFYIVKSGSFKSYFYSEDGCEQIVSFHFPGDMLGLDALAKGFHHSSTFALETASVCKVPHTMLTNLCKRYPEIWPALMDVAAKQVADRDVHTFVIAQKPARSRLAWFIDKLADGYKARGYCRNELNLSMSRNEIANYLAMAVETVSRLFGDFENEGILSVNRRFVRIDSEKLLREIAGGTANQNSVNLGQVG